MFRLKNNTLLKCSIESRDLFEFLSNPLFAGLMPKCQIGCNLVGGNNALNCDKKVAGSHLLQGQPNQ